MKSRNKLICLTEGFHDFRPVVKRLCGNLAQERVTRDIVKNPQRLGYFRISRTSMGSQRISHEALRGVLFTMFIIMLS